MFLINQQIHFIRFSVLIFLLAFQSSASNEELFPKKIDSDAITFLSASSEINCQFVNCGKSDDPLKIQTVTLSSTPVRGKEFQINIVFYFLSF